MSRLLSPIKIRNLEFKNKIFVSPMCQYSAMDGVPNDWHLVHLGNRAVGGAALVFTEATAVSPEGRISPADLGIWNDEQVKAFNRITNFISSGCRHHGSRVPARSVFPAARGKNTRRRSAIPKPVLESKTEIKEESRR